MYIINKEWNNVHNTIAAVNCKPHPHMAMLHTLTIKACSSKTNKNETIALKSKFGCCSSSARLLLLWCRHGCCLLLWCTCIGSLPLASFKQWNEKLLLATQPVSNSEMKGHWGTCCSPLASFQTATARTCFIIHRIQEVNQAYKAHSSTVTLTQITDARSAWELDK